MKDNLPTLPMECIEERIYTVRGQRVMLDANLAEVYGVTTFNLNKAVKRNADRFPDDFAFQITPQEVADLIFQIGISSSGHGGRRKPAWVYTEHGAIMAANVLNSKRAAQMSVFVVRAFIKQRELLAGQTEILKKLAQMDAKLLKHDDALRVIWRELQPLLAPAPAPQREEIGFHVREDAPAYGAKSKKRTAKR